MTSLIAAGGLGRSVSVIPAVPAVWSVTTIAFMGFVIWTSCTKYAAPLEDDTKSSGRPTGAPQAPRVTRDPVRDVGLRRARRRGETSVMLVRTRNLTRRHRRPARR